MEETIKETDIQVKEDGKELTLEEAFSRLDELLNQMSDKEVSLDESFKAYEKGTRLLKYCNDYLDRVEKQMMKLSEEGTLDEF